ncbi:uncharacterized protein N7500_003682 [Penicillium coprophilum]|uniref:uncharacterized protein n=1 Tax=Penicillium coprophilum TaxID=36646 RepID=UPI002386D09B|nr:uncharacterized protein N7500_003682 [Penicillium coprophilum]KAJ5170899.1 hypothetical protein N7500_003682 [Penicillium coprophilum]
MRFSVLALATFIGLAFASPMEAEKDSPASVQTNNCYTLCKIDGGSVFHTKTQDLLKMKFISASIALVLSLALLTAASPAELDKRACITKKCAAADPQKCCPDKYGFCNTDTKQCQCGKDCFKS